MDTSIRFEAVTKSFGDRQILKGVDLTVNPGGATFIVGTSGAGKSVLVRHAVGLLKPDSGKIVVGDVDITQLSEKDLAPIRRRCGYVFQHSTLLDGLTVLDNVALPLQSHLHLSKKEARKAAFEHLHLLHLTSAANRYPQELSAGARKQVAVCRSLTLDPQLLIFDEPTTGLDSSAADKIDRLIRTLCDDRGVTAVVVSHDRRSILTVADSLAFLYKGKIHASGEAGLLFRSKDPLLRQFLDGRSDGPMEV